MKATEVFVAYTRDTNVRELRDTLEAWDIEGEYEPIAIAIGHKTNPEKHDLVRIVAAEGIAKGDYIIANLGTRPGDTEGVSHHKRGQNPNLKVAVGAVQ